jgi:hypothetical protein
MKGRAVAVFLVVTLECSTTSDSGVRYLTASSAEEASRFRAQLSRCRLIERTGESAYSDDDTELRKRAVQYGADTVILVRNRSLTSPFVTSWLAEYYNCKPNP